MTTDTKARFTSGPWAVVHDGARWYVRPVPTHGDDICMVYVTGRQDGAQANAGLIAAAPTMHADLATISRAVRRLLTSNQCALLTDEEEAAIGRAEEIAKATGEEV